MAWLVASQACDKVPLLGAYWYTEHRLLPSHTHTLKEGPGIHCLHMHLVFR